MSTRRTESERFWSKVAVSDNPEECWEWKNYRKEKNTYGRFMFRGVPRSAHQVAYELTYGEYKTQNSTYHGICVCHSCDNRKCCNPSHLFLGTQADNNKDKMRKGRAVKKLTDVDKNDILFLRSYNISQRQLAVLFNVSQARIWRICNE